MLVSKVTAGEQRNCGLILKTDEESRLMTFRGRWICIPLSSVVLNNGKFTMEALPDANNWYDGYLGGGQDWSRWIDGKHLLLLANPMPYVHNIYRYDSDLITFGDGEFYTSSNGIQLDFDDSSTITVEMRYAHEAVWQMLAAFYGLFVNISPDIFNPPEQDISFIIPPQFELEIEQKSSGIKTGQFIL